MENGITSDANNEILKAVNTFEENVDDNDILTQLECQYTYCVATNGANPLKYPEEDTGLTYYMWHNMTKMMMEKLENLYSDILESSPKNLQYAYRIGFDVENGKMAAIQFELDPDKNIDVDDSENEMKEFPHIYNRTGSQKVRAIFKKDRHKIYQKITILPVCFAIGIITKIFMDYMLENLNQALPSDANTPAKLINKIMDTPKFRETFTNEMKFMDNKYLENYHVSKNINDTQGDGKYKITKLFWSFATFETLATLRTRNYSNINRNIMFGAGHRKSLVLDTIDEQDYDLIDQ